jgi:prepilin-type N-terminal cleavage/methylation domain-containing protein
VFFSEAAWYGYCVEKAITIGPGELGKGTPMKKSQRGFTLVEIAIVLVIIGLLLGGILKGQEMITQAKIKNVIADITGVSAAMYGYQDRYRALPGDDKGATRWAGATPATPGNGDGVIAGVYNYTGATPPETLQFWDHLRRAGFVGGQGSDNPFNAVSGKMGVQTGDGLGAGVLAAVAPAGEQFTGLILCTANLPDKIAVSVDAQMDDGKGKTGSVRGQKGGGNPTIAGAAEDYTEDGVSTYVVCRQM